MPSFVAFFDAAGSEDDGKHAIFVSGFVSTVDRWERFDRSWVRLLNEFGIKPPFHMSEFAYGDKQYASWREDKPRRAAFLTKAVDVTLRNILWSFSSGIILGAYDAVNAEYQLSESQGRPYAMCAMATTSLWTSWMRKRDIPYGKAAFEDGDRGRGDFIERFRAVAGNSPRMLKKGEFHALEAADLLAYEHAKLVRDVAAGRAKGLEDIRIPFQRFEDDGRLTWGYHNEESLRELVQTANIPRR